MELFSSSVSDYFVLITIKVHKHIINNARLIRRLHRHLKKRETRRETGQVCHETIFLRLCVHCFRFSVERLKLAVQKQKECQDRAMKIVYFLIEGKLKKEAFLPCVSYYYTRECFYECLYNFL